MAKRKCYQPLLCLNSFYLSRHILYNCLNIFLNKFINLLIDTGTTLLMFNIFYAKTHVQLNSHFIPKLNILQHNKIKNTYGSVINIIQLRIIHNALKCRIFKMLYRAIFQTICRSKKISQTVYILMHPWSRDSVSPGCGIFKTIVTLYNLKTIETNTYVDSVEPVHIFKVEFLQVMLLSTVC